MNVRPVSSTARVRIAPALLWILLLVYPPAVALATAAFEPPPAAPRPPAVSAAAWRATAEGSTAPVLVVLRDQADLTAVRTAFTKDARANAVARALRGAAETGQRAVGAWLDRREIPYRAFYVVNAILVEADRPTLRALALRPEVSHVISNPQVRLSRPALDVRSQTVASSIPWGVQRIGAPQAWALGYRGEGVVVAGQDTGCDWEHPALQSQYRGWDGASADHDYHWHDAIHSGGGICGPDVPYPCDDLGHGTHTMGTMVGEDGAQAIGVAPGAEWIGCRNMSEGVGTPATYAECFEFFLAPYPVGAGPEHGDPTRAPDVINNSWTCPPYEGCDETHAVFLRQVVENVRAAGILVVASAGNSGSRCESISDPPSIFDATLTVGATSNSDAIASFSSRGPAGALMKPDLTAPGVGVYSSYPNGGYGYSSGTSMAAPHVAGAAALLWSIRPDLRGDVEATERILTRSSVPLQDASCGGDPSGIPNPVYGWGRLDAWGALQTEALVGAVHDQTGAPIGGSVVEARYSPELVWRTLTDDAGAYALHPVSGTYTVTASAGGAGAQRSGVQIGGGVTTTLPLTLPVGCVPVDGLDLGFTPTTPLSGEPVRLSGSIITASLPVSYTWHLDGGTTLRAGNPVTHTFVATAGAQIHTVVVTAANRCSLSTASRDLQVVPRRLYLPLLLKRSL